MQDKVDAHINDDTPVSSPTERIAPASKPNKPKTPSQRSPSPLRPPGRPEPQSNVAKPAPQLVADGGGLQIQNELLVAHMSNVEVVLDSLGSRLAAYEDAHDVGKERITKLEAGMDNVGRQLRHVISLLLDPPALSGVGSHLAGVSGNNSPRLMSPRRSQSSGGQGIERQARSHGI